MQMFLSSEATRKESVGDSVRFLNLSLNEKVNNIPRLKLTIRLLPSLLTGGPRSWKMRKKREEEVRPRKRPSKKNIFLPFTTSLLSTQKNSSQSAHNYGHQPINGSS
eukprot:11995698-Ditylum_brightwellii.AAC.1